MEDDDKVDRAIRTLQTFTNGSDSASDFLRSYSMDVDALLLALKEANNAKFRLEMWMDDLEFEKDDNKVAEALEKIRLDHKKVEDTQELVTIAYKKAHMSCHKLTRLAIRPMIRTGEALGMDHKAVALSRRNRIVNAPEDYMDRFCLMQTHAKASVQYEEFLDEAKQLLDDLEATVRDDSPRHAHDRLQKTREDVQKLQKIVEENREAYCKSHAKFVEYFTIDSVIDRVEALGMEDSSQDHEQDSP